MPARRRPSTTPAGPRTQRCVDIRQFERRELNDDLGRGHPGGDHPDDRGNRDAQATETRHTTHLSCVDRDPVHRVRVSRYPTTDLVAICSVHLFEFGVEFTDGLVGFGVTHLQLDSHVRLADHR